MGDVAQSELIKRSGRDPELGAWISKRALLIAMSGTIALNDFSSSTYTKGGERSARVNFKTMSTRAPAHLNHSPFCLEVNLITGRTPGRPALHFVRTSHHSTL